jgi:hypothetical protein
MFKGFSPGSLCLSLATIAFAGSNGAHMTTAGDSDSLVTGDNLSKQ